MSNDHQKYKYICNSRDISFQACQKYLNNFSHQLLKPARVDQEKKDCALFQDDRLYGKGKKYKGVRRKCQLR